MHFDQEHLGTLKECLLKMMRNARNSTNAVNEPDGSGAFRDIAMSGDSASTRTDPAQLLPLQARTNRFDAWMPVSRNVAKYSANLFFEQVYVCWVLCMHAGLGASPASICASLEAPTRRN